ncbi:MAG TPA: gamma-glutamyl-gamma-aminobutyrate hydrolase family protein [Stenomitos sp.]
MTRPLIGITTQRHSGTPNIKRGRPLYYLACEYAERVREAGGVPLLLPPGAEETEVLEGLDGLLLSGGEDVDPRYYGEEAIAELGTIDAHRDTQELPLAKAAAERQMPILAICRGVQLLNVALGGTLYQDLAAQHPGALQHVQELPVHESAHRVQLAPDSLVGRLAGSPGMAVNTFHHQAVKDLAPGFRATAWAEDGVIEAIEGAQGWTVGVQWHPELQLGGFTSALFTAFVQASARYANAPAHPLSR